jgi:hypothetical protein
VKETLVVTETRIYSWLRLALCVTVVVLSAYSAVVQQDWVFRIAAVLFLGLFAFGIVLSIWRVRSPKRLATFTPDGVIDEFGQEFLWYQIDRVWVSTGCLFLKSQGGRDWFIQLDPAEVGWRTLRETRTFIKRHAPPMLTGKI